MSSTISVSRRAAAFRTAAGVFYLLFESTYESNVHPHRPSESCVAFGTAQQVCAWVLTAAAATAGGMLRGRGGPLSPLGYLRSWLAELKSPREFPDLAIELECSSAFYATVPTEDIYGKRDYLTATVAALRAHGLTAEADSLAAGERVALRLHEHAPALAAIYGFRDGREHIAPWRILKPYYTTMTHPELTLQVPELPSPGAPADLFDAGLGSENARVLVFPGRSGEMRMGATYEAIEFFLSRRAVEFELEVAGAGVARAKAALDALKQPLKPLPASAVITFDMNHLQADYLEEFKTATAPYVEAVGTSPSAFRMMAADAQQLSAENRRIAAMHCRRATVQLPEVTPECSAPAPLIGDLFAAAA